MSYQPQFQSINPYFVVEDVFASAAYYRDVFGFTFDQFWLEPPQFVIVMRDGIQIMLHQPGEGGAEVRPNRNVIPYAYDAYIYVRDEDSLYSEFTERGANTLGEPELMPHACREFRVQDLNGYVLCFGQLVP